MYLNHSKNDFYFKTILLPEIVELKFHYLMNQTSLLS